MDQNVEKVSKIELPKNFERLCKLFEAMENSCMFAFNKQKQITLKAVATGVAKSAPKLPRLTPETLAKIMYIYPTAYSVKLSTKANKPGEKAEHFYVLTPNFREDIRQYYEKSASPIKKLNYDSNLVVPSPPISPQKVRRFASSDYVVRSPRKSPIKPMMRPARLNFAPKFEPWRVHCRVKIFKYKLFEFLKAEHLKYLERIGVKSEQNDKNIFNRDFVENNLPEIPCAKLPVPERPVIQRTLREYLTASQEVPVLRSVEKVTQILLSPQKSIKQEVSMSRTVTPMKSSMNLLERIRAKEREAKEKEAARDLVLEKRLSHLEELQKRTLNVLFEEYKNHNSLEHSTLYKRLNFAFRLRQDNFNSMIDILVEIAPKHFILDTVTSRNTRYLRMLDKDLASITNILENEISQCKKKIESLAI